MDKKTIKSKSSDNKVNKNGNYGVLSLMAMTIGIVIGSGIFFKNLSLLATSETIGNLLISWIIGSLIVISLVIAYLEIISVTEISGEQSTIANWGRKLLGIRFGKFVGYYFTFIYFPIVLSALFEFSSSFLLDTVFIAVDKPVWLQNDINYTLCIILVAFVLLAIVLSINSILSKPGKYLQNIGTAIKVIPLIFIIGLAIMLFAGAGVGNPIVEPGFNYETSNPSGNSNIQLILATIPAILFTFDGFLFAGALSKEAKKPSSFRISYILSMIFIVIVYLLFSVGVIYLGSPDQTLVSNSAEFGTITNAIYNVFGYTKVSEILSMLTSIIITISILTSASGCSIAAGRSLSDLSVHNAVKDSEFKYITRNKSGVSEGAGLYILFLTIIWFVLSISMDTYIVIEGGDSLVIADFSSNLIIIFAFFIFATIVIGGLLNRMRRPDKLDEKGNVIKNGTRVPVKKNILFIPSAIISVILTFIITIYFGYSIFEPIFHGDFKDPVTLMKVVYSIVFISMIVLSYIWHSIATFRLKPEYLLKKERAVAKYYGELSDIDDQSSIDEELVRRKLKNLEDKLEKIGNKALEYKEKAETMELEIKNLKKK